MLEVERITKVSRHELRPDVFGPLKSEARRRPEAQGLPFCGGHAAWKNDDHAPALGRLRQLRLLIGRAARLELIEL